MAVEDKANTCLLDGKVPLGHPVVGLLQPVACAKHILVCGLDDTLLVKSGSCKELAPIFILKFGLLGIKVEAQMTKFVASVALQREQRLVCKAILQEHANFQEQPNAEAMGVFEHDPNFFGIGSWAVETFL